MERPNLNLLGAVELPTGHDEETPETLYCTSCSCKLDVEV